MLVVLIRVREFADSSRHRKEERESLMCFSEDEAHLVEVQHLSENFSRATVV